MVRLIHVSGLPGRGAAHASMTASKAQSTFVEKRPERMVLASRREICKFVQGDDAAPGRVDKEEPFIMARVRHWEDPPAITIQ